jgi:two-component system LytT family sensor kinase
MALTQRPRLYWLLQCLGWGLWGATGVVLGSIFGKFSWLLAAIEAIVAGVMLLSSHGLRYYVRRRGWAHLPLARLLPRLALANAVVVVASMAAIGLLVTEVLWLRQPERMGGSFPWMQYVGYAIQNSFVLWLWSAIYFGLHYFDSYRSAEIDRWRLAAAAREAEMRTLKAQLNPHFLFNGLNNIRALVMEDPTRARAMMTHLAELLRYSIQRSGAEQVSLTTELEIVEDYLQLEAMQLEERLRYTLDVAPETLPLCLPPMVLQLLVENGIKHGLNPRPAGGRISLHAWLEDAAEGTRLRIAVRNTGTYQPQPGHAGVGVRNVQERLGLLFGPAARFTLGPDTQQPDTVLADLSLPLTAAPLSYERAAD